MSATSRDGLAWDDSGLDLAPAWAREPTLDAIVKVCHKTLQVEDTGTCEVSFHAEGASNKLYLVRTSQRKLLMRVSLPVHPRNKTRGEVTTLNFLRRVTDVPVPEVIAFDDSANNEIGSEWIMMGTYARHLGVQAMADLDPVPKVALVQRMAELQAQISLHSFSGIGTLTVSDGENSQKEQPGEMVLGMFFWHNHFDYDIARGPFRSNHDWLASYLEIIVKDQITAKEEAEDEEDQEDAEFALALAQKLINLLPKMFPHLQNPPEQTVIWHQDLSLSNILIDEEANITAVIDWECVSVMPRWVATKMPKFLEGSSREKEPRRQEYADESAKGSEARRAKMMSWIMKERMSYTGSI